MENGVLKDATNQQSTLTPISSSRKRRFPIAEYNKALKLQRKELVNSKIENEEKLAAIKSQVHNLEQKIYRKEKKACELQSSLAEISLSSIDSEKFRYPKIASEAKENNTDKLKLSKSQFQRRKKKTVDQLKRIHSNGKSPGKKPVLDSLWSTLTSSASKDQMIHYVSNSRVCSESVLPVVINKKVKEYEQSEENKVRSTRFLYDGGLLSKRKYSRIRLCTNQVKNTASEKVTIVPSELMKGCPLPNILPYKTLMKFINSIDIGERRDLEEFAKEVSLPPVPGVYRPLIPFILHLADFYLEIDEICPSLHWFNNDVGLFYITIGADGAPFGKDDTATAYLVSFANLLQRVASCDDNHLLLGANCAEDNSLLIAYTSHLRCEIDELERGEYMSASGKRIRFQCELIPSDMKWASTMSGELNNNSTYFSPFANVNQSDKDTLGASIGEKAGDKKWCTWDYAQRLKVAEKVEQFKSKLPNKGEGKDRTKVTSYIAANHSRQEYKPPLGKLVDRIKPEPLHNSNNAWQQWFILLLTIAMSLTGDQILKTIQTVAALPKTSALSKFLDQLKSTAKCDRLHKKICNWFSDQRKKNITFSYRFTGKESKLIAKHSASLTAVLLKHPTISKSLQLRLHVLTYMGQRLRDCCAIFNAIWITSEQVAEMELKCKEYFTSCVLFCGKNTITPTVWTVGYAIPFHTRKIFCKLGFGLGLNTMQDREAKHVKLSKYMENTTNNGKSQRWWTVFRHEYVSLVWLRRKDPLNSTYKKKATPESFIPKHVQKQDQDYCHCGLKKQASKCFICGNKLFTLISESVNNSKLHPSLQKFTQS